MNLSRLTTLLDQYRAGTLSEADRAELERTLLSSSQAREEFWQHARFHALLACWGQESWGRRMAVNPATTLPGSTAPNNLVPLSRPPNASRRGNRLAWAAGLAAVFAALLTAWVLLRGTESPSGAKAVNAVAVLTRGAGLEAESSGARLAEGDALVPGWLQLRAGVAEVEFYSGASVILEAPMQVRVLSDRKLYLAAGRLRARVPEQARGFTVNGENYSVTDLGTEFGVSAADGQPWEVHVFAGRVLVGPDSGSTPRQEVTEGKALRWKGGAWETAAANGSRFVTDKELVRRRHEEWQERHRVWRQASAQLSQDPKTLVHFPFEDQAATDRLLRNEANEALPATAGSMVGCEWTEGRWPGKSALEFRQPGDRVRLAVTNAMEAATLLAWVRVDRLPDSEYAALAVSDGHLDGHAHWQITRHGDVGFSFRYAAGIWERCVARGFFTPEKLGRWMMLAATYDRAEGQIWLYADGAPLASARVQHAATLRLGDLELGNWGVRPGHPHWNYATRQGDGFVLRNFTGRMDEFALSARAWSAEEIRRYYELTRPDARKSLTKKIP
jgi:hypothetical protein